MNLYEITETGKQLNALFLNDEIGEEELEGTREFLRSELEEKSDGLVKFYNHFTDYLGTGTGAKKVVGAIDKEINRLKEVKEFYQKKFDRFTNLTSETMREIGIDSGKANGIQTSAGILYLYKSNTEIKPEIENLEDKYKKYEVKGSFTFEEFEALPKELKDKFSTTVSLNKELYEEEKGKLPKKEKYTLKVL